MWGKEEVVGAEGFEPPTPASQTLCSTRLSHAPTNNLLIIRTLARFVKAIA